MLEPDLQATACWRGHSYSQMVREYSGAMLLDNLVLIFECIKRVHACYLIHDSAKQLLFDRPRCSTLVAGDSCSKVCLLKRTGMTLCEVRGYLVVAACLSAMHRMCMPRMDMDMVVQKHIWIISCSLTSLSL
jgi:hypothetical protein